MTRAAAAPAAKRETRPPESASPAEKSTGEPGWAGLALAGGALLQRKLRLGAVDDPLEREADRVAEAVVQRCPAPMAVGLRADRAEEIQRCACESCGCEEEETVQRKAAGSVAPEGGVSATTESRIRALRGGGAPLTPAQRAYFEPHFGDLSSVRLHTGPGAQEAADAVSARAFTVGHDIAFGRGEYRPESPEGQRLLAHELTHTVQQGMGGPLTLRRAPCAQTNRSGGNWQHDVLEADYQANKNANSAREYQIPGGNADGGTGYADIVDLTTYAIYDFKPYAGGAAGVGQVAGYVTGAQANCGSQHPWHAGVAYPLTVIPMPGNRELVARQYLGGIYPENWPGVVVYWERNRQRDDDDDQPENPDQPDLPLDSPQPPGPNPPGPTPPGPNPPGPTPPEPPIPIPPIPIPPGPVPPGPTPPGPTPTPPTPTPPGPTPEPPPSPEPPRTPPPQRPPRRPPLRPPTSPPRRPPSPRPPSPRPPSPNPPTPWIPPPAPLPAPPPAALVVLAALVLAVVAVALLPAEAAAAAVLLVLIGGGLLLSPSPAMAATSGSGSGSGSSSGSGSAGGTGPPATDAVRLLVERHRDLIDRIRNPNGTPLTDDEAQRLLALNQDLLALITAADPNDPGAVSLRELLTQIEGTVRQQRNLPPATPAPPATLPQQPGGSAGGPPPPTTGGSGSGPAPPSATAPTPQPASPNAPSPTAPSPSAPGPSAGGAQQGGVPVLPTQPNLPATQGKTSVGLVVSAGMTVATPVSATPIPITLVITPPSGGSFAIVTRVIVRSVDVQARHAEVEFAETWSQPDRGLGASAGYRVHVELPSP